MAAPHSVDPAALLEQHLADASPDLLREMIATFANAMMSAQADQICGAGYGERSAERTNRRNGYRARDWDTRAGTVELAIPKLREGSFFPDWLLVHRRRAEQALVTVVATAYLLGVSTRRVERFSLAEQCRRRGIEPVVLRPSDDLLQLAEDAIARGADVIGMAGGDGSQALVASVAARHDVPHVCVPAGTRNHFALDLGLDRDDVVGALDAFIDGVERRIDLAAVNGRTFVNNVSIGLYAEVVQSPDYRAAKLKTAASILPDLLGPDATPLDLRYVGPDGERRRTAHLILVSNNPYHFHHGAGWGTRARIDRGMLGIVAVMIAAAGDAQRFVAAMTAGQVRRLPGWVEWTASRFESGSGSSVQIGVDGEALVIDPPVVFESRPGALRSGCPATPCTSRPPPGRPGCFLARPSPNSAGSPRVRPGQADSAHTRPGPGVTDRAHRVRRRALRAALS